MKLNSYYLELARDCLAKANNDLRHAEQYLAQAKVDGEKIKMMLTRIMSAVENRNKEIGRWLIDG